MSGRPCSARGPEAEDEEEQRPLKQSRMEEEDLDLKVPFGDSLSALEEAECLRFDGRSAVVVGKVRGSRALLSLTQKAACADGEGLVRLLPSVGATLTNHSGHEYSFYDVRWGGNAYAMEAIWPAAQWQIDRKKPAEYDLLEETPEKYRDVVEAFVAERAEKDSDGWIDAVASGRKEADRNLYKDDDFVVNVDTKWQSHEPLSEDPDVRKAWRGKPWTRDLYLLAVSTKRHLRSLRDLRGEHVPLCEAMAARLKDCALRVYGVPPAKLRLFFHYVPQFYRLHVHCTRVDQVNPGCEAERAHLLSAVVDHLKLDSDFYKNATLPCKLRHTDRLFPLLSAAAKDDAPSSKKDDETKKN